MKLVAQVAHVAQIGELTELRLVAAGNHVAAFARGQEVEVTVTAAACSVCGRSTGGCCTVLGEPAAVPAAEECRGECERGKCARCWPAVPVERPATWAVTTIGRCPACGAFPTAWNSMGVDCSECGVELFCAEDVDEDGASHWTFDIANQEDIDRIAAERATPPYAGER